MPHTVVSGENIEGKTLEDLCKMYFEIGVADDLAEAEKTGR
jgi:hypothetical protein